MRFFAYSGTVLLVAAMAATGQTALEDAVAAQVNEHTITVADVMTVMRPIARQLPGTYSGQELRDKLQEAYRAALNTLVGRRLILDAYEKRGMQIPERVVDSRIERIIEEVFSGDRAQMTAALAKDGLTYQQWRNEMKDQIIVGSMRSANIEQHVRVSPTAVRRYYDENGDQFRETGKVRFRMIALRKGDKADQHTQKREAGEKLLATLKAGADFAEAARSSSDGSHAADGGAWDWIEPSMLRSELAAVLRTLPVGGVSDIIETKKELYILKLEGRQPQKEISFKEAQPKIEAMLRRKESDILFQAWMERLRKSAYVKIFDLEPYK